MLTYQLALKRSLMRSMRTVSIYCKKITTVKMASCVRQSLSMSLARCWNAGIVHFPAVKQDPQGYASALTYARRYSLMSACGIAPEDDDGNAGSRKVAPASNPLDAIKPPAPAAELPYVLTIPGKEPRQYADSEAYVNGTIELRDKVEKSSLANRTKMTKLRELREANDDQINKIKPEHKAQLLGDYQLRLKRLGAQLEEKEDESSGLGDA